MLSSVIVEIWFSAQFKAFKTSINARRIVSRIPSFNRKETKQFCRWSQAFQLSPSTIDRNVFSNEIRLHQFRCAHIRVPRHRIVQCHSSLWCPVAFSLQINNVCRIQILIQMKLLIWWLFCLLKIKQWMVQYAPLVHPCQRYPLRRPCIGQVVRSKMFLIIIEKQLFPIKFRQMVGCGLTEEGRGAGLAAGENEKQDWIIKTGTQVTLFSLQKTLIKRSVEEAVIQCVQNNWTDYNKSEIYAKNIEECD